MKKIILSLVLLVSFVGAQTASAFSFDWGVTGGFNLKGAWTRGCVAASNLLGDEEILGQASAGPNLLWICRAQPKIKK